MVAMAYFLKKTNHKGKCYLAIYESFYDHNKKGTAHRSYQSLGSLQTLMESGIEDPVSFFQAEVDKLNSDRAAKGVKKISDRSPIMYLGYFPLSSIVESLKVKKEIDYFKLTHSFDYDLFELITSLVYSRVINPCSKYRTFHEIIPYLYNSYDYSYDQLLDGLSFIGNEYHKFVEIFTVAVKKIYGIDTSATYFDCTNFYFEIDREDDFRRKGPSKEGRKDPIAALGLLLDRNLIPIGMEMFPGNESEKPVLREVIDNLKQRNNITGRTIHVADKGLNCAENIAFSKKSGDGYLFSKSVKQLPKVEQEWILLDNDYIVVKDKNGIVLYRYKSCIDKFPYKVVHEGKEVTIYLTEKRVVTYNPSLAIKQRYEINKQVEKAKHLTLSNAKKNEFGDLSKYVNFTDGNGGKADVSINQSAIDRDLLLAGYNLLITSEINMTELDIYTTYHLLWRIEELFRIMKSELDARPVFLQKENAIVGHFTICYISVQLERIFEFMILENRFSASEIFKFIRGFHVIKEGSKYINTSTTSPLFKYLTEDTGLPLENYYLSETQVRSIFNYVFKDRRKLPE